MLSGLPASGKSTYAKELVLSGAGWVRVNKDLLRTMMHFDKWSNINEKQIQSIEIKIATEAITSGSNVVVDDTNLGERHRNLWCGLAKELGCEFEEKKFTTLVSECIKRDNEREKRVGADVIMSMALQYNLLDGWKDIIICDIDGTIADGSHRVHHVSSQPKDWGKYFSLLNLDSPRQDIIEEVFSLSLETGANVILVSGRPDTYKKETIEWLHKYNVPYSALLMRKGNDNRDDTIVKKEIFEKYLKHYNIIKVFDDRPKVIRMWRELKLNVCDVGDGVEF